MEKVVSTCEHKASPFEELFRQNHRVVHGLRWLTNIRQETPTSALRAIVEVPAVVSMAIESTRQGEVAMTVC